MLAVTARYAEEDKAAAAKKAHEVQREGLSYPLNCSSHTNAKNKYKIHIETQKTQQAEKINKTTER